MFSKPRESLNVKASSKWVLDRGKYLLFLPSTYTPCSCTVGLLLHLQSYQRWEPMIFRRWLKSKFIFWQPRYNNLLTEKKIARKFTFLKHSFFWKHIITVNLKNLQIYVWGKFYMAKFSYLSGRFNKVKERFWNVFDSPLCKWYWN